MKTFIATLALASLLAFPAFAQSYDPDLGSGNIARSAESTTYTASIPQQRQGGFARVAPGAAGSAAAAFAAVTPFGTPAGVNGGNQSGAGAARDAALRECSVISRRFQQSTWGTMDIHQHRACMVQHGQAE